MSTPNLTLCLITKNEARNLPACLASVRGLADEIVVVDTGSTDGTPDLARQAGAKVIEIAWPGDFSIARNHALAAATGRWILVLDADETLPLESIGPIRALIAAPARRAYNLIQRSQLAAGQHLDVQIVRLFPRDARVRFERPIHEQVNTSLERARIQIADTSIRFDHTGYADVTAMPAKTARNQALIEAALAREVEAGGERDPHLRYFYASTFMDAGDQPRAATEYLACALQCGEARPKLGAAARIKAAEAYFQSGDLSSALDALPVPGTQVHPLAASLRGEIFSRAGWTTEAIRWLEAVLPLPDIAYMPPVVLAPLKLKALSMLAEAWARQNRKDLAVGVLHLAVTFAREPASCVPAELVSRYRACRKVALRAA